VPGLVSSVVQAADLDDDVGVSQVGDRPVPKNSATQVVSALFA